MEGSGRPGSVTRVWRFPVKSMLGERLEEVVVTAEGLVGDRAYALIDRETGNVVSAKDVQRFPDLLACRAAFLEAPRPGESTPPARIDLPDGTTVSSDAGDVDSVLSAYFGREVTLAGPAAHPGARDPGRPGAQGPARVGPFLDACPVSVLTTSTLETLNALIPRSRFDERRFRMNLILETRESGFPENDWVGRELGIGDVLRLRVRAPDPRCVMTTLAQEDLPGDPDILRALALHNRLPVGDLGRFPCAGVYTAVTVAGTVRRGDRASLG